MLINDYYYVCLGTKMYAYNKFLAHQKFVVSSNHRTIKYCGDVLNTDVTVVFVVFSSTTVTSVFKTSQQYLMVRATPQTPEISIKSTIHAKSDNPIGAISILVRL